MIKCLEALLSVPFLIAAFFWVRGLFRGNKSDFVLGALLLICSSFIALVGIAHSGAISFIGAFLVLFGAVTLCFQARATEKKLMDRRTIRATGTGLVAIGVMASFVL